MTLAVTRDFGRKYVRLPVGFTMKVGQQFVRNIGFYLLNYTVSHRNARLLTVFIANVDTHVSPRYKLHGSLRQPPVHSVPADIYLNVDGRSGNLTAHPIHCHS